MLFSRRATLIVALGLVVPELLRSRAKSLEPYPAVILPAGAGTVSVEEGAIRLHRTVVSGRRDGKWVALDIGEFMNPIASHYFRFIAKRNLGLHDGSAQQNAHEAATELETKRWIRARLKAQGLGTRRIRLSVHRLTIELPSGKQLQSRVVRKTTYALD